MNEIRLSELFAVNSVKRGSQPLRPAAGLVRAPGERDEV
jgi:hypothetical protein